MIASRQFGALGLTLLAIASATAPASAREGKPNVILILADDLGWGDVGFNGRTEWRTPNLDRIGAGGAILSRLYSNAVVCAPSRAALLTGRHTIHNGVSQNNADLPAGETTLAEALKAQGYRTALFGKWHHGRPRQAGAEYVHPMDQGFDDFFGFTNATHAWEQYPKELWHGRALKPVEGYANDMFTGRAVGFLRDNRDRPFFLYLPYIATHFRIQAPPDEVALHRGKFAEVDPNVPLNATYAAMVTRLDRNVGRVLDELDALNLAGDTLLIFASDHGATFEQGNQGTSAFHDSNRPFRGQKRTLWEGGIRVPGLVRWPGHIPVGTTVRDPIQLIDLFPTVLATAGATPDPARKVDGLDVMPAWLGAAALPERPLFWEWRSEGTEQLAAIRGRFKLVKTGGNRPELFDVEADPAERRNIAASHPELTKQLQEELKTWLATEVAGPPTASSPREKAEARP